MTSPSITIGSSSSGSPSSVMSVKCRVRPSRTAFVRFGNSDVTVSILLRLFVGRRPHLCAIALVQAVLHVHLYCLVSSKLRFFTQDAHARSTPSLGSILPSVNEDGFSSHQCPLWLPLSTVRCRRHHSAVGGDNAPMDGCQALGIARKPTPLSRATDPSAPASLVLSQARTQGGYVCCIAVRTNSSTNVSAEGRRVGIKVQDTRSSSQNGP